MGRRLRQSSVWWPKPQAVWLANSWLSNVGKERQIVQMASVENLDSIFIIFLNSFFSRGTLLVFLFFSFLFGIKPIHSQHGLYRKVWPSWVLTGDKIKPKDRQRRERAGKRNQPNLVLLVCPRAPLAIWTLNGGVVMRMRRFEWCNFLWVVFSSFYHPFAARRGKKK